MAIPGTIQIPALASKPSAPPVSSYIIYVKTDNIIYAQDSSGNEYPFAATTAITALTGDVSATGPGSATSMVNTVGGQSAASVAGATVVVSAATSADTPSTLVLRDGSGDFSAGTITASFVGNLSGNASSASTTVNFSGSLLGDVTGTQGATSISASTVTGKLLTGYTSGTNTPISASNSILTAFQNLQAQVSVVSGAAISALTGDVTATGPGSASATVHAVGGATAANIASATAAYLAATNANTPSTLVLRDSSGNFSAGTITASLTGVASGNLTPPHNQVVVQKNPGTGQFSSVAAAIASITTASSVNPFEIIVHPGVYVEPAITMKSYVYVNGQTSGTVILVPSSPNAVFISGVDNSGISRCIINGANGLNGVGLFHQGTLGQAFVVEFCVFSNSTLCVSTTATIGNPSKLELSHCYFQGSFTTGLLATTDGASVNQVLVDDLVYSSQGSPYATDVIVGHGVDLLIYVTNSQFIQTTGNCIRIYDGAQLLLNSCAIVNFGKALWVQNSGSAPSLAINGLLTQTNTVDIQVDHTGTTGSISGSFDANSSTISSSNLSIFTSDPTDGVTITGSISYGDNFSDRTNVTELILGGPTMGVYSGGVLTSGGGLVVDVSAGSGYFSTGTPDTYLVWSNSSITLSANTTNYIFWNSSRVLSASASLPDTRSSILLGRVVTNASGIEFIDASPLTANHYGNLNDNFIRDALGPVFASGCVVSEDATPLHLDVSSGSYFFGTNNFQPSAQMGITFQTFYQNGTGGWNIGSTTIVDTNNYDNGTGTLQPIPGGYYARHSLYLVGQGANQQYLFVYGQTTYASLSLAQTGNIPNPPSYFTDGVVLLASLIVLQGSTSIVAGGGQIVDNRPRIGFALPAVEAVGSVVSVALALPVSLFSVGGSPVTSSGTLTGTLINQTANTVFAGPSSGGAATPAFRALVSADVPPINLASNANGGVTGILPNANTTAASANTPSAIVTRDSSGNFSAGTITASLTGNVSGSSASFTGSLVGDVTGTQGATVVSLVGGRTASDVAAATATVDAATSANTPSTLVKRDSSGNFSAGTITASLTGNVSGSAASFTGSLVGDVTGTQGATSVAKIQGTSVSGTTGTVNVVFSTSPTLTGTLTAASISMSGTMTSSNNSTGAVVINTSSFIFDSTNNALGIGVQPSTSVMIDGVNTSGSSKLIQMTGYGVGSTTGYRGRFARGTLLSPSAVQSGDILNALSGRGYGASQFASASTGAINVVAGETFTNTSNLTYLQFSTTPTGSVTSAEAMRIATTGVTLGPQSSSTAIHQISGGWNRTTRTLTAATLTVDTTTTDDIIYTDSTSNAITITLPPATNGRMLMVQDKTGQAGTNHITVTPTGSVTINGVNASVILGVNYGGWVFTSDGSNWTYYRLAELPSAQALSGTVIDWSTVGVAGGLFTKTLSANTTFTFSNATAGQTIVIRLTNTASNYTVTWPTIKWPVQTSPVQTTGAFSDVYTIVYDGTNYFGSYVQNL